MGGLDWDLSIHEALLSRLYFLHFWNEQRWNVFSHRRDWQLYTYVTAPHVLRRSDGNTIVNVTSNLSPLASSSDRRANAATGYVLGLSSLSGRWLANELERVIVNDNTSEDGRVALFALSALACPGLLHYCGDYSRCITTWFNRACFCLHSRAAQCSRVLSSNRRSCPAPFVIPAVHWKRLQSGGMGGKKKSMLSNAEIGKCHFDKCKALCTHRLNFDGSLPRRGLLFLFISLHTKMLNNDVTESKYKCHQHKRSPDEPEILFFSENVFPSKIDRHLKLFWTTHAAIFRKMLHEAVFWYGLSRRVCMCYINANEFALVQTEAWVYCWTLEARFLFHSFS